MENPHGALGLDFGFKFTEPMVAWIKFLPCKKPEPCALVWVALQKRGGKGAKEYCEGEWRKEVNLAANRLAGRVANIWKNVLEHAWVSSDLMLAYGCRGSWLMHGILWFGGSFEITLRNSFEYARKSSKEICYFAPLPCPKWCFF